MPSEKPSALQLGTLAAAFAANGHYDHAVSYQSQAFRKVPSRLFHARRVYESRLALYKAKKPLRLDLMEIFVDIASCWSRRPSMEQFFGGGGYDFNPY
jgi:hypothetical protein